MLTKIADAWIDVQMVTAVAPYLDNAAKPCSMVKLQHSSQIVSVTADDVATAINKALQQWKAGEKCANQ